MSATEGTALSTTAFATAAAAWPDYMTDAVQRSILFLDLLRTPRQ